MPRVVRFARVYPRRLLGKPPKVIRIDSVQAGSEERIRISFTSPAKYRRGFLFPHKTDGVTAFNEIGSGKVLSGLIKRIVLGATTSSVGTPDDVVRFKAAR